MSSLRNRRMNDDGQMGSTEEVKENEDTNLGCLKDEERKNDIRGQKDDCRKPYIKEKLYVIALLIAGVGIWWVQDTHQASKRGTDLAGVVTLRTHFNPLDHEAFNSFTDNEESKSSLHGVLSWKSAAVSWSWMQHSSFAALMPREGATATPGHVWRLLHDTSSQFMYSYKYTPPPPYGPLEELLYSLLSLFHPQPFLISRYGPRGAAAVVRAKTHDTLDVLFRLHAEYQLNTPPRRPLWFTPAAFLGRLVINTTDLTVNHFTMGVPSHRELNVDLEWLVGPNEDEDIEVTITHLEDMHVAAETTTDLEQLVWTEEIPHHRAMDLLQQELYKFKQVEYHNFSDAFKLASQVSRPVHTLVLWGVLEDQSC